MTERAYAPLVAALYRHPEVKASLHFSGPLLDWLEANRPDVIGDLSDLVRRGQIELLSGGYYEPILVGIPRRDAVGQIRALTDRVAAIFGQRPLGAWLTERVWEPHLPSLLAEAGVAYTVLDDEHFLQAGLRPQELGESYVTEDQGLPVIVFPGSVKLRYLIPFRDVSATIKELRERQAAGRAPRRVRGRRREVRRVAGHVPARAQGRLARAVLHRDRAGRLHPDDDARGRLDLPEARAAYLHPIRFVSRDSAWALDAAAARRLQQARHKLGEDLESLVARSALAELPREIP